MLPSVTTFETVRKATEHWQQARWSHQLGASIALAAAVTIPVFANGDIADPAWAHKTLRRHRRHQSLRVRPAQCLQTQLQAVTCSSWETHE